MNTIHRPITALALGAATLLVALLLQPGNLSSQEPEFNLNFGTVAPDNTPWSDQLKDIKRRVEKESGGRIRVRLFTGGSMGGEVEMIQDIRDGGRFGYPWNTTVWLLTENPRTHEPDGN